MSGRRRSSWRSFKPGEPASAPQAVVAAAGARRVLGLDPGSRITGFGVIDVDGREARYVASVLAAHQPEEVAIERVFVHVNPDSALKLGQARGAALCATFDGIRSIAEYTPREVKLAVTGSGAADKSQVARMVKVLLGLEGRLQADAADALAIALCHAHGRAARLALAIGRAR